MVICSFFVTLNLYHSNFKNQIVYLQDTIPLLLDRYRYLILSYTLLRERIIYNNSLSSFERDPIYHSNIDQLYNDLSITNEVKLAQLKLSHKSIVNELLSFVDVFDTPNFCDVAIGSSKDNIVSQLKNFNSQIIIEKPILSQAFQSLINTVIAACRAALSADIEKFNFLIQEGLDLNLGDWDSRSPLYYAVRSNNIVSVKYLI